MKLSKLFGQTLRDSPAEAEVVSHSLLVCARYIRRGNLCVHTIRSRTGMDAV